MWVPVVLVVSLLAGCGVDEPSAPEPADLLVELVAVGGMCPTDECRSVTTVDRTGTWVVAAEDGSRRTGALPTDLLAELTAEVERTPPGSLTSTPFTGECARDMDGTEWILTLLPGSGAEQRVSTCEHVIPDVPVVAVLQAVSEETRA